MNKDMRERERERERERGMNCSLNGFFCVINLEPICLTITTKSIDYRWATVQAPESPK